MGSDNRQPDQAGNYPPASDSSTPKAFPKVFHMSAEEGAFAEAIAGAIDDYSGSLTVFQICGALFAAAHDVMQNQEEFEE